MEKKIQPTLDLRRTVCVEVHVAVRVAVCVAVCVAVPNTAMSKVKKLQNKTSLWLKRIACVAACVAVCVAISCNAMGLAKEGKIKVHFT